MQKQIPLVALVGRPNVGKSTLFNRLVGRKTALVHDMPGVTRDRIFGEIVHRGKMMRLVDTGGLEEHSEHPLLDYVRAQTQLAIDEADLVVLVVDAAEGLTLQDREVAQHLRRCNKQCIVVANKIDTETHDYRIAEIYGLGLDPVFALSAEHGRGAHDLMMHLFDTLKAVDVEDEGRHRHRILPPEEEAEIKPPTYSTWKGGPIHVAVVGRPNAGKSSLINRVLGEDRHLATEVAGTTMDAIDSSVTFAGQDYVFIDTAGMRRRRSVEGRLEHVAVIAAMKSIDRADIVLLVLDGTQVPTEQDTRIASMAHEKGKALIIVVNKWDLPENTEWKTRFSDAIHHDMPFAAYAPILKVSAKTGRGMEALFGAIVECQHERYRRVGTGELNRFFKEVVDSHPPPIQNGKRPKLYFVSQPLVCPPTFIFASNRADDLHFSYIRYLQNALRDRYGFKGTPLWLKFREKKKDD